LPENCWDHEHFHLGTYFVAALAFSAQISKVFRKGICSGVTAAAIPVWTKFCPAGLNDLPDVINVLFGSSFQVALGFADVAFVGGNAFAFIYHHASSAKTIIHAFTVFQRGSFVAIAFHVC